MRGTTLRTLRGRIRFTAASQFEKRALILDDGLLNVGYRIESFTVWPEDPAAFAIAFGTCWGQLATDTTLSTEMSADDNRQIGWSIYTSTITKDILDPEHMCNRDLYLRLFNNANNQGVDINYLIKMRKYALTDDEAIITIIKEESQSVD